MAEPRIIVFGAGSRIMSDEGVGIAVLERLARADLSDAVTLRETGTDGYSLLCDLEEADVAIIVDCAKMGRQPGTVVVFDPQEVQDVDAARRISLHSVSLLRLVRVARQLGYRGAIRIVGIEPQSIQPGEALSEAVARAVPVAVAKVKEEIERALRNARAHDGD